MSVSDGRSRRSRRSRVSGIVDEPSPSLDPIYDDPTDRVSNPVDSPHALPIKPPASTDTDPNRLAGNSAEEYYHEIATTPSDGTPTSPTNQALSRRRTSSHGLSHSYSPSHGRHSRRTRSHSSARDVLRVLLSAESSEAREALALLRKTSERLELESHRANEAERRVQEANERWRLINQSRQQAQTDANRASEELRLYKMQLEAAQQQIARANDMVAQTDKEKIQAEEEAAKARRQAKKYEMESMIQKAREEGRRLGREQGLKEGREIGIYERGMYDDDYDRYPYEQPDPYDNGEAIDDDGYSYIPPANELNPLLAASGPVRPNGIPLDRRQQRYRSAPPIQARAGPESTTSRGPRRSNGLLGSLSRMGRDHREPGMDRNVAINPSNAPDVATIIDDEPINALTSPLPPEQTSQMHHTTTTRMPEPNFHPDPSDVHPISVPGLSRSPLHPPTSIPPDNYIPRQDADGMIRMPPPHEMGQAPPTPHSHNTPMPNTANLASDLPAELPQRERGPVEKDFAYTTGEQSRSRSRHGRHRYQKSVADSDDSVATANLSIISPPGVMRGVAATQPRLSVIPETDGRYASPSGSMRREDVPSYPGTPRSLSGRRGDPAGMYTPENDAMYDEGPVRPVDMGATFSPRSVRSGYTGPRRPSRLTTPAPLAPQLAADDYNQPAYTRPRINSIASSSGLVDVPHPSRSRDRTPGPDYNRGRRDTDPNSAPELPEIQIVPASRSESLQSRTTNVPRETVSPRVSSRNSKNSRRHVQPPEPPSPIAIPGMPRGFVPTSPAMGSGENGSRRFMPTTPTIPEGAPLGFVPHSPGIPEGAPIGFVPTSPAPPVPPQSPYAPPGAPLGFVPTSPAIPPGAPIGFVPTSPAVPPGAPLGFVPTSPAIPPGAPLGFVPTSPAVPPGAPLGFLPTSTTMPTSPLPRPSPNMSVSGALPVLARSASDRSGGGRYYGPSGTVGTGTGSGTPRSPRVSFDGPNAGFNSRAASDWDTRSAWGETRTPKPVRGPDLASPRVTILRPGSSLSRRDSSPVIPDPTTYQPSLSRRASRATFVGDNDPATIALPPSKAPSFARSGRSSSHGSALGDGWAQPPGPGLSRSQSARSDSSRTRAPATMYPYTSPNPARTGLPPVGLGSPYSRRLDPHAEDDPGEFEVVPSDDSQNTLTTPPERRRELSRGRGARTRGTPAPPMRSLDALGTPRVASRTSLYVPPDPATEDREREQSLRRSASRQSIASNNSYAKFIPEDYVDPAVLTSGRSRLLNLPSDEPAGPSAPVATGKNKNRKKKKGR